MAAIVTTSDGELIFMALEDSGGFPVFVKATRPVSPGDAITFTQVYAPGAGTAGNVIASGDPDIVYFYGNFGSGVQVIKHTISGPTNTNVSPSGLTTKVINAMAVNPVDANELWVTVNTDQDLLHSTNGGISWSSLNAALGVDPTAMHITTWDTVAFVAGNDGANVDLLKTVNSGSSFSDVAGAALGAAADVTGIEGRH